MGKGIYIKPSKRKCSVSDFMCFDIYDNNKKKINMIDCDVISIDLYIRGVLCSINMEIIDGLIHIWTENKNIVLEPLINTFIIKWVEGNE